MKKTTRPAAPAVSIFDHKYFPMSLGVIAVFCIALIIYFIDFFPSLGHLDIGIFSGDASGNYFAQVAKTADAAKRRGGSIENIATSGSMDNIKRLQDARGGMFALSQDGMPWGKGLQLVAYLTSPETLFIIGPAADRINGLSDLKNMRIGIGPQDSGSAYCGERIFKAKQLTGLNVTLSNHGVDEQLRLLRERKLDLGLFVISEKSEFIEQAVAQNGMQIASLKQVESISRRLPFLKPGEIREGFYDPVNNIPRENKKVLKVHTVVLTTAKARRSQVIGLLSVLADLHPRIINHNRNIINQTGLPESDAARDFFNNNGPEILDRYSPRLMDFLPLSNLVQIAMAISIFFNLMGVGNRFLLWRIDANRIGLEVEIREFFGRGILPEEIEQMAPASAHRSDDRRSALSSIIERMETLENRCRTQSQGLLVPMGGEMAYRYQEEIISRNLVGLRAYRERLGAA